MLSNPPYNFEVIFKWISKMLSGSCSALLLGFLVTILAVECSNASSHQVGTQGNNLSSSRAEKDESLHTDILEGTIATSYVINYGRKILEKRKNLPGMDEKLMYISPGKNKADDPEKKSFPVPHNKESDHIDAEVKKNGLTAFLEAADQVANLMRRDYTGGGHGRRKPPIHNQEPKD